MPRGYCHSLNERGATVTGISATDALQQMCEEFSKLDEWTLLCTHDHQLQIKIENNIGVGATAVI